MKRRNAIPLILLSAAAGLSGCPGPEGPPVTPPTDTPVLKRPSKSSTVAIADDDSVVVMSNPDDDSISIFDGQSAARVAKVRTGDEPWAVVIHPDKKTAFVANRADGTVVKVSALGAGAMASAPLQVGSEPTGLALSPTGGRLFVAEWGESRVSVVDTATMQVVKTISVNAPRALVVTNSGDKNEDDELLVVPEFYGEPQPGGEAKDNGRKGKVRLFSLKDYGDQGTISFAPLTADEAGFGVGTAPNQLGAVAVFAGKIYVPSVSASPQGPPKFDNNVNPVVYVGDLSSKAEVKGNLTGTLNLAREVNKVIPAGTGARLFLADLRDVDFVPGSGIAYFVSQGADAVQRVRYDASGALAEFGSTQNKQIDVIGDATRGNCHNPNGIVVANTSQRAYVNCWVSRRLGVIDLAGQALSQTVVSSDPPSGAEVAVQRGKRFYFTGRGRWANEAWSSCGTCHPDGLSDNITWIFAAGPRQTTSMDGSFSHGAGAQKQRIFNWTAIIDEMHDFEANTRGTSGGLGAITSAGSQNECGDLTKEKRAGTDANGTLPAGLGTPTAKELQDGAGMPAGVRCTKDWDEVNEFAKTIRPPRGRRGLDAASVSRGAQLFKTGGCDKCHGGAGWTASRRFYTPSSATNMTLAMTTEFAKPAAWPQSWTFHDVGGVKSKQIAAQPVSAEVAPFNSAAVAPPQLACAIRNVGTFGVPGDVAATDALEIKPGNPSPRAQGRGGYNVPSLYGVQVGGPYLHHGQARTLEELFTDAKWLAHTQAGAANFLGAGDVARDRQDLVNYLLSIDASTPEVALAAGFEGCPAN
jgi:YVTN family beta-propeller protein